MSEIIYGTIERITFRNADNGFTIAKLKIAKKRDLIIIVGTLASLTPGETVELTGQWKRHKEFGLQFEVIGYKTALPQEIHAIEKYLASGLIKGIGPVYAKKIVKSFAKDTFIVFDKEPEKLHDIPGIGPKRVATILKCWEEQKEIRTIMVFLQKFDIPLTYAQKIYRTYGKNSAEQMKKNPYRIAQDIRGIGFKTADMIALRMGIPMQSAERLQAGLEHLLGRAMEDGHTCLPQNTLIKEATELLEATKDELLKEINALQNEERIEIQKLIHDQEMTDFVFLKGMAIAERGIAYEIRRLQKGTSNLRTIDTNKAINWAEKMTQMTFAEKQVQAITQALNTKFCIITGGPGTGKSTITKAILDITKNLTNSILLAAPTGRAAKRQTEITGITAKTIHALLEFDFTHFGFKKNRANPLSCDLIIIDEASMIDTQLMYSLLKAIPTNSRVLLIGDIHQLPSVGPGTVLKDLIKSEQLPTVFLNEIYRQAQGSKIITNAHKVNQGYFPDIENQPNDDFFFVQAGEPEEIQQQILSLILKRVPDRFKLHPTKDIQVLSPMKRGLIGIDQLNLTLQEKINPSNTPLLRFGRRFHVKDKVMQLRNNYDKNVFNGDIGWIDEIDFNEEVVAVTFDERQVFYDFSELDELSLAYVVSIHKYQGSECPCIIIPVHTTHFMMLQRNLLYTGITRGKKLVILVGTQKAISIAVRTSDVQKRYTSLIFCLLNSLKTTHI